jgi:hypothetical protein
LIGGTIWQTHSLISGEQDYGFQTGRGLALPTRPLLVQISGARSVSLLFSDAPEHQQDDEDDHNHANNA